MQISEFCGSHCERQSGTETKTSRKSSSHCERNSAHNVGDKSK